MSDYRKITSPNNGLRGGRPQEVDSDLLDRVRFEYLFKFKNPSQICKEFKLNRSTLYRYKNSWQAPHLKVGISDFIFFLKLNFSSINIFAPVSSNYDLAFARLVGFILGKHIQLVPTKFGELCDSVNNSTLDIALGRMCPTPERAKIVSFAGRYASLHRPPVGFVTSREFQSAAYWQKIVPQKKIGCTQGTIHQNFLLTYFKEFQFSVHSFRSDEKCVAALRKQKIDLLLTNVNCVSEFFHASDQFVLLNSRPEYPIGPASVLVNHQNQFLQNELGERLEQFNQAGGGDCLAAYYLDKALSQKKFCEELNQVVQKCAQNQKLSDNLIVDLLS